MKVIRIIKDTTEEIPESMIGEIFVVQTEFDDMYVVDATAFNGCDRFDVYKEECNVLSEEVIKDILYRKLERCGERLLSM